MYPYRPKASSNLLRVTSSIVRMRVPEGSNVDIRKETSVGSPKSSDDNRGISDGIMTILLILSPKKLIVSTLSCIR